MPPSRHHHHSSLCIPHSLRTVFIAFLLFLSLSLLPSTLAQEPQPQDTCQGKADGFYCSITQCAYYRCVSGVLILFQCPSQNYRCEPSLAASGHAPCVFSQGFQCAIPPTATATSPPPTVTASPSPSPSATASPSSTAPPPEIDTCVGKQDGFYCSASGCAYYRCVSGVLSLNTQCPADYR